MALKHKDMIAIGESVATLEIAPRTGESIRVKEIGFTGAVSGDTAELKTDETSVGFFILNDNDYRHLNADISGSAYRNLFRFLAQSGIPIEYPVAEGETFRVIPSTTLAFIYAIYDVLDAGDVSPDHPNGSEAKVRDYLKYLTNASVISSAGYSTLDKRRDPVEYPGFPLVKVPSKSRIDIRSIMCRACGSGTGDGAANTGSASTEKLRLFHQQKVLFDRDRGGHQTEGSANTGITAAVTTMNYSQIRNLLSYDGRDISVPRLFSPPLSFLSGEELDVQQYVYITGTGNIPADELLVALLCQIVYE